MQTEDFIRKLSSWGKDKIPFLFMVDFEMEKPLAFRLDEIDPEILLYNFNGIGNSENHSIPRQPIELKKIPITLSEYEKKFKVVLDHLVYGDSYVTNLTIRTGLEMNVSLRDLFFASRARYKLLFRDEFLVFSPEIFIQIIDNSIHSYPMKGTIDASIPQAREKILNDTKELAEHVTIVDLIRNDLGGVSDHVQVKRFRYIDELITTEKKLLQVSSEIVGALREDYPSHIGEMLISLLPAGSVSGAPKPRTMEVIRLAEKEKRGYYTGVFGLFDGRNFDSGVMIRFIERVGDHFYYRSGGGITTQSILEKEYQEALDKVYVPVD